MNIEKEKTFIKNFHQKRCGTALITSRHDYRHLVYKTLVTYLTIFNDKNWENFECTQWVAAINLYEIEHALPHWYATLRHQLENNHKGFYIEEGDFDGWLETNSDEQKIINSKHQQALENCQITSACDYEYHLHRSINEMFNKDLQNTAYKAKKWWQQAAIYEDIHQLPSRTTQFYLDERFREFARLRKNIVVATTKQ